MVGTSSEGTPGETGMTTIQEHSMSVWKTDESDKVMTNPARREIEDVTREKCVVATVEHMIKGKSYVLLQVNCRSICNKTVDFWNLIDTYNPDIVICTESWLSEEISNAEVFRADHTTFRRDRHTCSGGVFICVKYYNTCAKLRVDEVYEMTAVEVKGMDSKLTWEIVGIYRAPNKDMQVLEKLADRTRYVRSTRKHSIIGGDLNLPHVDWDGHAGKSRGTKVF